MNSAMWDPVLKFFLLNSIFAGPVNSAQDLPFFSKTQKSMFNVHSKCTLRFTNMQKIYIVLAHITLHDQTISEQIEVTILHSNS